MGLWHFGGRVDIVLLTKKTYEVSTIMTMLFYQLYNFLKIRYKIEETSFLVKRVNIK